MNQAAPEQQLFAVEKRRIFYNLLLDRAFEFPCRGMRKITWFLWSILTHLCENEKCSQFMHSIIMK